jgi:putative endonuclease
MYKTLGTHSYYVYILTNINKSVLYIGVTNQLKEHIFFHQNHDTNSEAFTAKYNCYYLIYWEHYANVNLAIDREKQLKRWTRIKKDRIINSFNPDWKFLNDEV